MTRHPLRIALVLLVVAATALALRFATREDATRPVLTAPASGPTTCRTPSATGPVPAPSAASLAGVSVPGATSIDTRGLLPGPVVESADGSAWAIVGTSNAGAIGGRVARIDAERTTISTVTTVVDGCDASALAAGPDGIWVGTCDARAPAGSTSGAELVRIDPVDGQVRSRVTLPGTCVAGVAVAGGSVWATNAATIDAPQRLWRLDVSTGAVDEPVALGADETITGLAATSDAVWTSRRTRAGDRIVRSDARSGADTTSFATGPLGPGRPSRCARRARQLVGHDHVDGAGRERAIGRRRPEWSVAPAGRPRLAHHHAQPDLRRGGRRVTRRLVHRSRS